MKLFDEKGKLFGKINLIDFLVIIVIIVALVVVGAKVLGGGNADGNSETSDSSGETLEMEAAKLTYVVRATAQSVEVAEQLVQFIDPAEGRKDQLMHSGELVEDAYVVDFWTEPCRYNMIANGSVEMIAAAEADAADLVDICLVVEAVVEDAAVNKVGALEVRVGKNHLLKTAHLEFANGFVTACEWEPVEE